MFSNNFLVVIFFHTCILQWPLSFVIPSSLSKSYLCLHIVLYPFWVFEGTINFWKNIVREESRHEEAYLPSVACSSMQGFMSIHKKKKKKSSYTFLILSAGKHQQLVTTCKSHILHSASPLPRWHSAHFLSPPRDVFSVHTPPQPSVSFSLLSSSPISPHPSLPSGLSHRQQHAPKSFSQTVSR